MNLGLTRNIRVEIVDRSIHCTLLTHLVHTKCQNPIIIILHLVNLEVIDSIGIRIIPFLIIHIIRIELPILI